VPEPGLFPEPLVPELEGDVGVGFVLAFVFDLSLFPDPFPFVTVFALGGAWYRNGTAPAMRLEAMMAIAPMRRLLAGRFIVFLGLPLFVLPSLPRRLFYPKCWTREMAQYPCEVLAGLSTFASRQRTI